MSDEREFLMIENRGTVSTRLLTVVGASTSRHDDSMIGQFGSGFKYSVALLLRHGIDFKLFTGKQGWVFGCDSEEDKDVRDRDVTINEVYIKGTGPITAKRSLGFDMNFGEIDWTDPERALLEFISNAADASMGVTTKEKGDGKGDYTACQFRHTTSPKDVKGKEGHTRIFVDLAKLKGFKFRKHFMIHDPDYDPKEVIMTKREPNSGLRVYRRGVLVGAFDHFASMFDYNFPDIPLKESRIITESDARTFVAEALKTADDDTLARWLEAARDADDVFEVQQISRHSLRLNSWDENREELVGTWQRAWVKAFGTEAILCDNKFAAAGVESKGYPAVQVKPELKSALASYGLKDSSAVLDHYEAQGRKKVDLTPDQLGKMVEIWECLVEIGVTKDRPIPVIEGFHTVMDAGGLRTAYYDPARDVVGMSADVLSDEGFTYIMNAVEEFGHAITRAKDETRDLQDWAFRVASKLMERELKKKRTSK